MAQSESDSLNSSVQGFFLHIAQRGRRLVCKRSLIENTEYVQLTLAYIKFTTQSESNNEAAFMDALRTREEGNSNQVPLKKRHAMWESYIFSQPHIAHCRMRPN